MSGKIIIAGATGYTGAALARSFAKDDIQCHLIGRNEEELKKLASENGPELFSMLRCYKSSKR
jgi:NADP-dependent 3-hydroxy acid dehydrogenase YdfG